LSSYSHRDCFHAQAAAMAVSLRRVTALPSRTDSQNNLTPAPDRGITREDESFQRHHA
jgi:hypothetical protein